MAYGKKARDHDQRVLKAFQDVVHLFVGNIKLTDTIVAMCIKVSCPSCVCEIQNDDITNMIDIYLDNTIGCQPNQRVIQHIRRSSLEAWNVLCACIMIMKLKYYAHHVAQKAMACVKVISYLYNKHYVSTSEMRGILQFLSEADIGNTITIKECLLIYTMILIGVDNAKCIMGKLSTDKFMLSMKYGKRKCICGYR